jgi:hypothetical protein
MLVSIELMIRRNIYYTPVRNYFVALSENKTSPMQKYCTHIDLFTNIFPFFLTETGF